MDGITLDPRVQGGKPVIAGTRVTVDVLVHAVAAGDSVAEVANAYRLSDEQVRRAVRYAAELVSSERSFALPG